MRVLSFILVTIFNKALIVYIIANLVIEIITWYLLKEYFIWIIPFLIRPVPKFVFNSIFACIPGA